MLSPISLTREAFSQTKALLKSFVKLLGDKAIYNFGILSLLYRSCCRPNETLSEREISVRGGRVMNKTRVSSSGLGNFLRLGGGGRPGRVGTLAGYNVNKFTLQSGNFLQACLNKSSIEL